MNTPYIFSLACLLFITPTLSHPSDTNITLPTLIRQIHNTLPAAQKKAFAEKIRTAFCLLSGLPLPARTQMLQTLRHSLVRTTERALSGKLSRRAREKLTQSLDTFDKEARALYGNNQPMPRVIPTERWYGQPHPMRPPREEMQFDVLKMLIPVAILCVLSLVKEVINNDNAENINITTCEKLDARVIKHQATKTLITTIHATCVTDKGGSPWRRK